MLSGSPKILNHKLSLLIIRINPRKKMSLGENLAESHAYNPIQDSGETFGEREKSRQAFRREFRIRLYARSQMYCHN